MHAALQSFARLSTASLIKLLQAIGVNATLLSDGTMVLEDGRVVTAKDIRLSTLDDNVQTVSEYAQNKQGGKGGTDVEHATHTLETELGVMKAKLKEVGLCLVLRFSGDDSIMSAEKERA
jgi:hypothetical protein